MTIDKDIDLGGLLKENADPLKKAKDYVCRGDKEMAFLPPDCDAKVLTSRHIQHLDMALQAYSKALQDETILSDMEKQYILDKYAIALNLKNKSLNS